MLRVTRPATPPRRLYIRLFGSLPVTVLYLGEALSSTAIIQDQGALWGVSLLTGLFAIAFTAGGGYHMAAWIRRRRMAR